MSDKYCHDCWYNTEGVDGIWYCSEDLKVKECKKKGSKQDWGGRESLGHSTSSDRGALYSSGRRK